MPQTPAHTPGQPKPSALISTPPKRIVFVCVHNSARSQMAEALARRFAPSGVTVWSAGTRATTVHPMAVQVLEEIGLDLSGQRSKTLDEVPWQEADTVVSLCDEAEAACPTVGVGVRRLHWPLPDPAAAPTKERIEAFRQARDELRWRVASLWPGGD